MLEGRWGKPPLPPPASGSYRLALFIYLSIHLFHFEVECQRFTLLQDVGMDLQPK